MALVLTITTGRVEPERAEDLQAAFRSLMGRRFTEAPFLRQAMLVEIGDDVWQMMTLWDSALALTHTVDNDVPLTVRLFREFGADPEIRLGEVSVFLQPIPAQPAEPTTSSGEGDLRLRVLEDDQSIPPRPEEEAAAALRGPEAGQDDPGPDDERGATS